MNGEKTWQDYLGAGVNMMLREVNALSGQDQRAHIKDTAKRVVRAYECMVSGYAEAPERCLETRYPTQATAMVHVKGIRIATTCAHHLFPVIGTAHFAYVPDKSIVGLSKIPRFIDILCRRLQVQEELCDQIVGVFYNAVRPGGCAVRIEAVHSCMSARGVREHGARTVVTGVRGSLRANARARMEFLAEAAGTVVGGEMDDAG